MAVSLMKNEKIVWKSYPGKNYRLFVLGRDLALGIFSALVVYFLLEFLGVKNQKALFIPSVVIFVLWGILAAANQIALILVQYILTTERIIIKKGWLNRTLISIRHENIVDTEVKQSVKERVINTGTIYLYTANDSQTSELNKTPMIENIDFPFERHTKIMEVLDKMDVEEM